MKISDLIQLALTALQVSLSAAKVNGWPIAVISDLEAGIAKLQSVQGTQVTWEQLNDLRLPPPGWEPPQP